MNWYCDDASYANISNKVQFFGKRRFVLHNIDFSGFFIGTLLFGFASDVLGRKLITILAVGLGIAATAVSGIILE